MKLPQLALFAALLVPGSLDAADWPQWLGPKRDGVSPEKGLLQTWPKDGPKLLWTFTHAGEGYSCPVIVGDRLYLSGARGDAEFLFALDLQQVQGGAPKELWAVKIGPRFDGPGKSTWNAGPIATPVVDDGMVYAQGGSGELVGVNFDRNRYGLVRNFVYTDVQARHIAVHSRAVLEALRKVYAAESLLQELTQH